MIQAKFYDEIYSYPVKHEFVLKYLKGKTVIDVGGGTGLRAELLEKEGFECKNIEPQKEMADISVKRGIVTDSVFFEKTDNILMIFNVVGFLDNIVEEFENVSHCLRPGGRFIFDYWNSDIKESGIKIKWNGLLTRISYKRWKDNNTTIYFLFPFKLCGEKNNIKVYSDNYIKKLLKNFKIIKEYKTKYNIPTMYGEIKNN